ncbi:GT-D fold domain-containing protein [Cohnella fermenti]|uniref:GT-D fold domain-containing protein n=1 Tax=Cohnella fermenti TaxID=2565925 RepID=UPI001B3B1FC6|nr:GT-D fold domain-containing glycosyltransferase [Cohnella fermenti]
MNVNGRAAAAAAPPRRRSPPAAQGSPASGPRPASPRAKPRVAPKGTGRGGAGKTRGKRKRPLRRAARERGERGPEPEGRAAKAGDAAGEDRYSEGYRDGAFAGGESLLEAHLPPELVFPNVSLEEFLAAGISVLRPRGLPLLGTAAVYEELERALSERRAYSLVRLGDGELLTLAQDTVMSMDEVRREGFFLPYAGIEVPDHQGRDELASAMRTATVVGIPLSRRPLFQPLLFAIWKAYGIQPESLRLTSSTVNYSLKDDGYLHRLIAGRRLALIGDLAEPLASSLLSWGAQIAATVSPVKGIADYRRVVDEAAARDFDLALVSAGIAAVPICVHLANRTGKVCIDFGHLANAITGLAAHPGRKRPLAAAADG